MHVVLAAGGSCYNCDSMYTLMLVLQWQVWLVCIVVMMKKTLQQVQQQPPLLLLLGIASARVEAWRHCSDVIGLVPVLVFVALFWFSWLSNFCLVT